MRLPTLPSLLVVLCVFWIQISRSYAWAIPEDTDVGEAEASLPRDVADAFLARRALEKRVYLTYI